MIGLSSVCVRLGRVRSLDSIGLAKADGVTDNIKAKEPEHPNTVSMLRCETIEFTELGTYRAIIPTRYSSYQCSSLGKG